MQGGGRSVTRTILALALSLLFGCRDCLRYEVRQTHHAGGLEYTFDPISRQFRSVIRGPYITEDKVCLEYAPDSQEKP